MGSLAPASVRPAALLHTQPAHRHGGRAYAFAVEPAGTTSNACGDLSPAYSGTVVALDRHGDPLYTTTIVVP